MAVQGTFNFDGETERQYWDTAEILVLDAQHLQKPVDLRRNLSDPCTSFKVESYFENSYRSSYRALKKDIEERRQNCRLDINKLNGLTIDLGIMQVKRPEALIDLLLVADRRKSWKRIINHYRKEGTAISLQEVEKIYQMRLIERAKRRAKKLQKQNPDHKSDAGTENSV